MRGVRVRRGNAGIGRMSVPGKRSEASTKLLPRKLEPAPLICLHGFG